MLTSVEKTRLVMMAAARVKVLEARAKVMRNELEQFLVELESLREVLTISPPLSEES